MGKYKKAFDFDFDFDFDFSLDDFEWQLTFDIQENSERTENEPRRSRRKELSTNCRRTGNEPVMNR